MSKEMEFKEIDIDEFIGIYRKNLMENNSYYDIPPLSPEEADGMVEAFKDQHLKRKAVQKAIDDARIYGAGFFKVDCDGNITSLNPKEVIIGYVPQSTSATN